MVSGYFVLVWHKFHWLLHCSSIVGLAQVPETSTECRMEFAPRRFDTNHLLRLRLRAERTMPRYTSVAPGSEYIAHADFIRNLSLSIPCDTFVIKPSRVFLF
uniref:Secreted protein n=1 Tax=Cacopsylla melanoneura TaxID=428564 RepID=A0A8D9E979_9HEMI